MFSLVASAVSLLEGIKPVWVLSYIFSFCQLAVFAGIISQFISTVISQPNYPTKITEEMFPLCVLLLSTDCWCLYLQPTSVKTGRGRYKLLQRENVGHSAAAGSRWGVITVSPAEFVFIHRIKWEGKKPDLYKEKKNHWVGWGNIV